MLKQLMKLQKDSKGFTLIELMIVVAIIGILAAIAIPQFAAYRQRAYNSAAEADLRNFKTAMEVDFGDHQQYDTGLNSNSCDVTGCTGITHTETGNALVPFKTSNGVTIKVNDATSAFAATAAHKSGNRQFGAASDATIMYYTTYTPGDALAAPGTTGSTAFNGWSSL